MATNGGEFITQLQTRVEELERDVRILLRAQVLRGDALRVHGDDIQELKKRMDQMIQHGHEVDERVDKLVSAIGELVRRMDARQ